MKRLFSTVFFLGLILGCGPLMAGSGHYTSGVEGIKAASVPPPGGSGFYGKLYNVYYSAGEMRDNQGRKVPTNFDLDVLVQCYRLIYSSDIKVLGGNLLFDILIPVMYTDIYLAGAIDDNRGGLGDIFIEPLFIGWHGERWDALAAFGIYVPTGRFDSDRPASPGSGFWTYMFSLGGTVFFDPERTWSASVLARYQIHTKQDETDITSGDHFSFEWGLGKNINGLDLGLAGYCHWQVSDDKGPGAGDDRERAFAAGPEIAYTFDSIGLNVSLRSLWEFENKNKSQGNITVLNLTYAF